MLAIPPILPYCLLIVTVAAKHTTVPSFVDPELAIGPELATGSGIGQHDPELGTGSGIGQHDPEPGTGSEIRPHDPEAPTGSGSGTERHIPEELLIGSGTGQADQQGPEAGPEQSNSASGHAALSDHLPEGTNAPPAAASFEDRRSSPELFRAAIGLIGMELHDQRDPHRVLHNRKTVLEPSGGAGNKKWLKISKRKAPTPDGDTPPTIGQMRNASGGMAWSVEFDAARQPHHRPLNLTEGPVPKKGPKGQSRRRKRRDFGAVPEQPGALPEGVGAVQELEAALKRVGTVPDAEVPVLERAEAERPEHAEVVAKGVGAVQKLKAALERVGAVSGDVPVPEPVEGIPERVVAVQEPEAAPKPVGAVPGAIHESEKADAVPDQDGAVLEHVGAVPGAVQGRVEDVPERSGESASSEEDVQHGADVAKDANIVRNAATVGTVPGTLPSDGEGQSTSGAGAVPQEVVDAPPAETMPGGVVDDAPAVEQVGAVPSAGVVVTDGEGRVLDNGAERELPRPPPLPEADAAFHKAIFGKNLSSSSSSSSSSEELDRAEQLLRGSEPPNKMVQPNAKLESPLFQSWPKFLERTLAHQQNQNNPMEESDEEQTKEQQKLELERRQHFGGGELTTEIGAALFAFVVVALAFALIRARNVAKFGPLLEKGGHKF